MRTATNENVDMDMDDELLVVAPRAPSYTRLNIRITIKLWDELAKIAQEHGGDNVSSIARRFLVEGVRGYRGKGGKGK